MTTDATKQADLAGPECHDWPHEAQPLLDLLKEVCEAHAPSGVERELDAIITRRLAPTGRAGCGRTRPATRWHCCQGVPTTGRSSSRRIRMRSRSSSSALLPLAGSPWSAWAASIPTRSARGR